ncbi:uncharacterized protein LOC104904169 [Beta vulgaris subsp. vulgaris]|uniref:uncharacterized protein LOC104904169 n=1 Tax=Beta vulgaris subsp. vulgaris TaxID=3555 RepID=UPI00053F6904|nr:uncharacterized protein LOC104904169 [Beta vulgaris subsp. vulgaris]
MAKLGWKVSQAPKNLAQECINSKYIYDDKVTKFSNGSNIWKNIGKGWRLLQDNCFWSLGNGRKIKLWADNWLSIGSLTSIIQGPLMPYEEEMMVSHIVVNGKWDVNQLSMVLPHRILDRILSFHPPSDENRDDMLIPSFTTLKGFSLARAYEAQFHGPCMKLDWFWNHPMEPKLKFFFWLLWRDQIPHKWLLYIRHITPNSNYPRCASRGEDSDHVIRGCTFSQDVWALCTQPLHLIVPLVDWLQMNLESEGVFRGYAWTDIFPYLCHELWKERIECALKGKNPAQPSVVVDRAIPLTAARAQAYYQTTSIENLQIFSQSSPFIIENQEMYINVDASFTHINENIGAIEQGLHIAKLHDIHPATLYSDCLQVINLLCNNDGFLDNYMSVLENCQKLWKDLPNLKIKHCKRQHNKIADALAKACRISKDSTNDFGSEKLKTSRTSNREARRYELV